MWCLTVKWASRSMPAHPQFYNIYVIKRFLDKEHQTAAHAFGKYCSDAGNTIPYGIAQCQLQCIQRPQTTAARIVIDIRCYKCVNPALRQRHWLPIEFKVLCLMYKALRNMVPLPLTQLLSQKKVARQLRCNDQHLLEVPLTSLKYAADRLF